MDWDENRVFQANVGHAESDESREFSELTPARVQSRFREFIRNFREANVFPYRDQLNRAFIKRDNSLEVDLGHVQAYDPILQDMLQKRPNEQLPLFEAAAKQALRQIIPDRDTPDEQLPDIHITLKSDQHSVALRHLTAADVNSLVKVPGIVISASRVRAKSTLITIKCRGCGAQKQLACKSAFGGVNMPRVCETQHEAGQLQCPLDPFLVVPDKSVYVDQQTLKLQESPEVVPTGEMPRNILLSMDRTLVDKVPPGSRVSVIGIASIFNSAGNQTVGGVGIRTPYIRVVGIQVDEDGVGRAAASFTPQEEERFCQLAREPDIYEKMCKSIAPSISGDYTVDIKKALACQLFSGSRKMLPDGMKLRGDINILLLGDPSTAKSQFLKFIEKVAPVGVYTSGKGSSAAGLTASVIRDAKGEFFLEGGAMVLADGGIVCIDEFDKMREDDRVAIHEAMEQQTISIAKAGITTILNSRSSVLAAANPIYGRYDDMKSTSENIDLMTTILSRFDLIFIVRDVRDEEKDRAIARHVMGVHINSVTQEAESDVEIDIETMKKYVQYCRSRCAPRLSEEGAAILRNQYVQIRNEVRQRANETNEEEAVPITVRQLEALIRISESLAKMTLSLEAGVDHVNEAIRLFKCSTMTACGTGSSVTSDGGMRPEVRKEVQTVEDHLSRRVMIGSNANTLQLQEEFKARGFSEYAIKKAIDVMTMRGEFKFLNNKRLLKRLK